MIHTCVCTVEYNIIITARCVRMGQHDLRVRQKIKFSV